MKKTLTIFIILFVHSLIQCNAQIDFDKYTLLEEVTSPTIKKVFPGVGFNCAKTNMDRYVVIGEYENKKYLFETFSTFQFNTLYDEVKDENNCTLKEKLTALVEIFSYVKENYKDAGVEGIIKYKENKFSIDTLYEVINLVYDSKFQWYSKCTSQNGYFEIYFRFYKNEVIEMLIKYNGGFAIHHWMSSASNIKGGLIFESGNIVPEIYGDYNEYYIVINKDDGSTNNLIS